MNNNSYKINNIINIKNKKKLNITTFIIGIVIFILLLVIIISNYENQEDEDNDGSKIFKPILAFILCLLIIMKIYNGMYSNETTSVLNRFKIDKGLLIYLLLAVLVAFII